MMCPLRVREIPDPRRARAGGFDDFCRPRVASPPRVAAAAGGAAYGRRFGTGASPSLAR